MRASRPTACFRRLRQATWPPSRRLGYRLTPFTGDGGSLFVAVARGLGVLPRGGPPACCREALPSSCAAGRSVLYGSRWHSCTGLCPMSAHAPLVRSQRFANSTRFYQRIRRVRTVGPGAQESNPQKPPNSAGNRSGCLVEGGSRPWIGHRRWCCRVVGHWRCKNV